MTVLDMTVLDMPVGAVGGIVLAAAGLGLLALAVVLAAVWVALIGAQIRREERASGVAL
jgi:hypothetical protein